MSQRINPLKDWRGSRSPCTVAFLLGMTQRSYLTLENNPRKSKIKSNTILKVARITGIPLTELVDYLTQTNTLRTKEMA